MGDIDHSSFSQMEMVISTHGLDGVELEKAGRAPY